MKISDAQQDMRLAYVGGGTGVLASGIVWIIAAITAFTAPIQTSMLVLFFGGMFIFPLSMLLSKALKRTGQHQSGNPLGTLAMESTVLLFIGLFIAFSVAQAEPSWFFPIMLLTIGGRYLIFASIYGMRIYWALGGLLALAGGLGFMFGLDAPLMAGAGGVLELIFSAIILASERNASSVQKV